MPRSPSSPLPPPPSEEALMAAMPHTVTTDDDLAGLVDGADGLLNMAADGVSVSAARRKHPRANTVQHTTSTKVTLYDEHGESHVVPVTNLTMCLANGLFVRCPLCQSHHADDSPNACPAQPQLLYTLCPICRTHGVERRIYEERLHAEDVVGDGAPDDPNYVKPLIPDRQSREKQLGNRLTQHMLAYHKSEAGQLYGLSTTEGAA